MFMKKSENRETIDVVSHNQKMLKDIFKTNTKTDWRKDPFAWILRGVMKLWKSLPKDAEQTKNLYERKFKKNPPRVDVSKVL